MRSVLYLATILCVMTMAFWAYRENYRTQAALGNMMDIRREIGGLREEIGVLRAEWAFLNRPERLTQLVNLNFEKLKIVPMTADQFVDISHVAYPAPKPVEAPLAEETQ